MNHCEFIVGRKTVAAGNYTDEQKSSQVGTLKQLFSIWF